ncbi:MAG: hypothetical protein HY770_04295 [Chitinivibrionia bacterium]|nr:hypothetical protein [Chitinivibrionia bacterium]
MRSLRHLRPVLVICTVVMLGMFAGCGNNDDPVIVNPPAVPSGGYFAVYADMGGSDCNLQDPGTGIVTYYVVHMGMEGATAAEFEVQFDGFTGTMTGMTSPFQTAMIDPQEGSFTLAYGACTPLPAHVATLRFNSTSATPACATARIVPHPVSGRIGVVDCSQNYLDATGKVSYFNNDGNCPCSVPSVPGSDWTKIRNIREE